MVTRLGFSINLGLRVLELQSICEQVEVAVNNKTGTSLQTVLSQCAILSWVQGDRKRGEGSFF